MPHGSDIYTTVSLSNIDRELRSRCVQIYVGEFKTASSTPKGKLQRCKVVVSIKPCLSCVGSRSVTKMGRKTERKTPLGAGSDARLLLHLHISISADRVISRNRMLPIIPQLRDQHLLFGIVANGFHIHYVQYTATRSQRVRLIRTIWRY